MGTVLPGIQPATLFSQLCVPHSLSPAEFLSRPQAAWLLASCLPTQPRAALTLGSSVLFYFILFYFILFYFILFYFIFLLFRASLSAYGGSQPRS